MTLTIWILAISLVILVLYDIYAVKHFGVGGTISWVLWSSSKRFPLIPLAVGVLMGHLFWRQEAPPTSETVKCGEMAKP